MLKARLAMRGREAKEDMNRRLERADVALPEGVVMEVIDNSGPLDATVRSALAVLYPVRA